MNTEVIKTSDKTEWLQARLQDVTSTEVSALFGVNPYMTKFELWYNKKDGKITEIEENERMKWGNRLEASIAKGIAEDHGWSVVPLKNYNRVKELRIGSSFDFAITQPFMGILEIKNVDAIQLKEKWGFDDDENPEAPPHIELQVQHQMLVSGMKKAYIGALVGGNEVKLIERDADLEVHQAIKKQVKAFWDSIKANEAPSPDYERDADLISKIYGHAEPGKIYDGTKDDWLANMANDYQKAHNMEKLAQKKKKVIKSMILERVGKVEKVVGCGEPFTSITLGMIGPAEYTVKREGYRNFKINFPRTKKK